MEILDQNHADKKKKSAIPWPFTHPVLLILIPCILLFLIHPQILNFRFYSGGTYEPVPMAYVSDFYMWTRHSYNDPEKIVVGAKEILYQSYFKPQQTYFIIHGFTCNGLDDWIIKMKNALLWREDCNVISVNWQAGSLTAGYYVIQARVPDVGEDVATLIKFLMNEGKLLSSHVHLIGHSLGAHVAGFAGKTLHGTLARITGLDPAGLAYNRGAYQNRLDKSDALFVDIIHTHGCYTLLQHWTDCYGTYENIGDADFWPNGGEHQPACEEGGDGGDGVREGSNCHHGLAYVYYTESIQSYPTSTRYLARECSSWGFFNKKLCACQTFPQYMGYNVNSGMIGIFFLNTSRFAPYGLLDPECSAAQYSLIKITGVMSCLLLVAYGLVHICLAAASLYIKEDLTEFIHLDSTKFLRAKTWFMRLK